MKFAKAFGQFWYDFIVGDDWKIAAAVVAALAITAIVMSGVHSHGSVLGPWNLLGGFLVLGFFVVSVLIDTRPKAKK